MDLTKIKQAEEALKTLKDLKAKKKSLEYALECSQKPTEYGNAHTRLSVSGIEGSEKVIVLSIDEWKLMLGVLIEDVENRIYLAEDEIKKL